MCYFESLRNHAWVSGQESGIWYPIIMLLLHAGPDAVPSALVSQMVEEALEQDDRVAFNKDRSG